jgi:hypothetical protein
MKASLRRPASLRHTLPDVEAARLFSPGTFLLLAIWLAFFIHATVRGLIG